MEDFDVVQAAMTWAGEKQIDFRAISEVARLYRLDFLTMRSEGET